MGPTIIRRSPNKSLKRRVRFGCVKASPQPPPRTLFIERNRLSFIGNFPIHLSLKLFKFHLPAFIWLGTLSKKIYIYIFRYTVWWGFSISSELLQPKSGFLSFAFHPTKNIKYCSIIEFETICNILFNSNPNMILFLCVCSFFLETTTTTKTEKTVEIPLRLCCCWCSTSV
jgi:hypothetical protein